MKEQGISCEQIEVRGIERRFMVVGPTRTRIRDEAFLPRKSGKDNDGLSVTAYREGVLEVICQNVGDPNRQGATLHCGHVRTIRAGDSSLDVIADPIENLDPFHALITGYPPRNPAEELSVTRLCERLAEKLALQARPLSQSS